MPKTSHANSNKRMPARIVRRVVILLAMAGMIGWIIASDSEMNKLTQTFTELDLELNHELNHELIQLRESQDRLRQKLRPLEFTAKRTRPVISDHWFHIESTLNQCESVLDIPRFRSDRVIAKTMEPKQTGMFKTRLHVPKGNHKLVVVMNDSWAHGENGWPKQKDYETDLDDNQARFEYLLKGPSQHWIRFGVPNARGKDWIVGLTSRQDNGDVAIEKVNRFEIENCFVNGYSNMSQNNGRFYVPNHIKKDRLETFQELNGQPWMNKIFLGNLYVQRTRSHAHPSRLMTRVWLESDLPFILPQMDADESKHSTKKTRK